MNGSQANCLGTRGWTCPKRGCWYIEFS